MALDMFACYHGMAMATYFWRCFMRIPVLDPHHY